MNEMIDLIFKEGGIINSYKENYAPRPSQIEAADLLFDALSKKSHMILEGPCGFGKTFAYLIPLFLHLTDDTEQHRVIIATNGIALSEQLIYQDLPVITNLIRDVREGKEIPSFALLKGKGNFLCMRKYREATVGALPDYEKEIFDKIKKWLEKTDEGDFSELQFKLNFETTSQISCNTEGECLGKSCGYYAECFYQKQKAKAMRSKIIVTNYHLLFSDYKSGGNILPPYDILLLDEAHEAANIFRDFGCDQFSASTFSYARNKVIKLLSSVPQHYNLMRVKDGVRNPAPVDYIFYELMTTLIRELETSEKLIHPAFSKYDSYVMIEKTDKIPNGEAIVNALNKAIEEFEITAERYTGMLNEVPEEVAAFASQLNSTYDKLYTFKNFMPGYSSDMLQKEYAFYYERQGDSIKFSRKRINVGGKMYESYFNNPNISSVICTSATLSVGGTFNYFKSEMGLSILEEKNEEIRKKSESRSEDVDCGLDFEPKVKEVVEFIGQSPFDLLNQQLWYMPVNCVDGNKGVQYDDSMEDIVTEIINAAKGGILFLCTSNKNMNNVYNIAKMNDFVIQNNINVLKQGSLSVKQITEEFRGDKESILVATRSFFTGIDIPGDALRCVVIDKFPFPSPAEPVMKRLSEQDSGAFYKYSIPIMITTLKQAIGRGVRSKDDKCVIAFMDRRMKTARYVGTILKSFPNEKKATRDPKEVTDFLYN